MRANATAKTKTMLDEQTMCYFYTIMCFFDDVFFISIEFSI